MKQLTLRMMLMVVVLTGAFSAPASPSFAQADAASVTFVELGLAEQTLRGPYSSLSLSFAIPADWELTGGAELTLALRMLTSDDDVASDANALSRMGATFGVTLNGYSLTNTLLDTLGAVNLRLDIPTEALVSRRSDGRQELVLFLESSLDCDAPVQPVVVVGGASAFALPHTSGPVPVSLARLPFPIYQNALLPDQAVLIVPDRPTTGELRAALAVAAGLGRSTFGELGLSLVPVSQLTSELRDGHHLIFVGKPAGLPPLGEIRLPGPVTGAAFAVPEAQPGDGILQMATSPWNSARAVLVVSGDTDEAVLKAGQAMSAGNIRAGSRPDVGIVAQVRSAVEEAAVPTNQTLASLDYQDRLIERVGNSTADYVFYVPAGQGVQGEAYFDLVFNHSALLNYERSTLTVNLNNRPLGSVRLTDESTRLTNMQLPIPAALVRPGFNRLTITATLSPEAGCIDPRREGLWLMIGADSLLHLPLAPSLAGTGGAASSDLGMYPASFLLTPALSRLAFVLPAEDAAAWQGAMQLAFQLGDIVNVTVFDAQVAWGDDIAAALRQQYDLFIVGRPSQLPVLADLGGALPAPFDPGSDVANERNVAVEYRRPKDASIGYLQLLPSPWNADRVILAALGNSDEAMQWATSALTNSRLRNRLSGNFAVINGDQITASDTRLLVPSPEAAVPAGDEAGGVPIAIGEPVIQRPAWILPALALSILAMLAIIGFVLFTAWRGRHAR